MPFSAQSYDNFAVLQTKWFPETQLGLRVIQKMSQSPVRPIVSAMTNEKVSQLNSEASSSRRLTISPFSDCSLNCLISQMAFSAQGLWEFTGKNAL